MLTEIKSHWIVHPFIGDFPISLRALKPKGSKAGIFAKNITFLPNDYPCSDALKLAFEKAALRLNAEGHNVYCVMNRIRPDFPERGAVTDADITHRTMLLIDIDRVGDTSCPATEDEVHAAFELGESVSQHLANLGFPKPHRVHSGNGLHIYYHMRPEPETDLVRANVESLLKGLAAKFNNGVVGIDTSVFNASRITKLIGSVARKGQESEGREFRRARML